MGYNYIAKGLFTSGMLPLDEKIYFRTINEIKDLGTSNNKAFMYYEYMKVICVENGRYYVWKEVAQSSQEGTLENNYQYPSNTISFGIDYSNRFFNFVLEPNAYDSNSIARPYVIYKDWDINKNNYLEINDIVMGHFSSTLFITAKYLGGDISLQTSWAIIANFNPTTFTK